MIPGANEGKKRKSSDADSILPPSKKYKPVNSMPRVSSPHAPRMQANGLYGRDGMHATVMNPPTLSPQGQLPHKLNAGAHQGNSYSHQTYPEGTSSASSRSPANPTHNYGYSTHSDANGYVPQLPLQAYHSPHAANGTQQNHHPAHNVGWSARYSPPKHPQHQQNMNAQPPPLSHFINSFERQPPSDPKPIPNIPTPLHNGFLGSPTRPSPSVLDSQKQHTPQVNGVSPHQGLSPNGPPVPSPVKQSPPPATQKSPNHTHRLSSSPVANQPPLKASISASPGYSPTKHSPPRPPPPMKSSPVASVLPPAPQLSPSPIGHRANGGALNIPPPQPAGYVNGHKESS